MKANKIYNITFDTDETIMTATLSKLNEVVMLMSSGSVIRFNLADQKGEYLFSVKSDIGYSDGGFDITAKTSIYTMDEIVVIVNNFKTHGFVHYPGQYNALHLWRKDYHADISNYPIALYKSENGVPHLIYGKAWNHIISLNGQVVFKDESIKPNEYNVEAGRFLGWDNKTITIYEIAE